LQSLDHKVIDFAVSFDPMNILFTSLTYYPHKGGAEACIEDLARAYVERGHQVTVVTSRQPPSLVGRENQDGVAIIRLKYPPQTISGLKDALLVFARGLFSLLGILQVIRSQQIDVVCLGLVGIDSFLVLLLSYIFDFKLIVYIHGGEIRSYVKVSRLIRWTLKGCLRRCFATIAVSEELKNETIAFAPEVKDKIFVIANGVDLEAIEKAKVYQHPRKYVLYVGRLHPVKGLDTLVQAFQRISEQAPELDLLIAGEGPLELDLKNQVAEFALTDRIIFLGAQERTAIYTLLKACEFLVLPSHAEGCPVVLLEALATGKMTIGSRAKGIASLIQPGENGALFDPGQVAELSNLMLRYHRDAASRTRLEQQIKTAGAERYDIQRLCEEHLDLYAGLKKKLRICLVSDFYYQDQNCAGLSSYYFNLAESLSKQGHDLCLVTSQGNSDGTGAVQEIEIKQLGRPYANRGGASIKGLARLAARLSFSLKAYLKIRKLNQSRGVDVIVAPELFAPGFFVGLFLGRKLITRIHAPTYLVDYYNQRYRYPLIGKILSVPEKAQAKMSQGLSVASERLAALIAKDWRIPRDKIQIIPNSVQVEWVRELAAQQPREISGDYLLYFGRFERLKGVHIISAALSDVFARVPAIKMVFAGKDCGLKEKILQENDRHRERIIFFDTMEKERLFGVVRYARLILLPSLFENFSNAGLEAMALAKPVIGTFGTCYEELIEDNLNGFLVEAGNPTALGAKILSALERTDLEQIGRNAYESILRFDSQKIVSQNIEFYRSTIAG
jgi:glycosyltransferase involved in cell wall biosynthesis